MVDTAVIDVRGLRKSYRGAPAVRGLDLDVRRGEIFALLGPNGAGKTTLINIVCGIVNPSSGKVLADGHDIARDWFSGVNPQYWYFPIGVLLIAVVLFLPNGILGGMARLVRLERRAA